MKAQNQGIYVFYLGGVYVALMRDPRGGGFIAKGTTHADAIINALQMSAHYN